jgi:hypothetical protein
MDYELIKKWPFDDFCIDHFDVEDNKHIMRGGKKEKLEIY